MYRKYVMRMALLLWPVLALGQGERATATGTVTDSMQALIPGANVSIRNIRTNVITRTESSAAGIYYLPALPPG